MRYDNALVRFHTRYTEEVTIPPTDGSDGAVLFSCKECGSVLVRDTIEHNVWHEARDREPAPVPATPDVPTPQGSPLFTAIWHAIKGWDIQRFPENGYAHATGDDVQAIVDQIRAAGCTWGSIIP